MTKLILRLEIEQLMDECAETARRLRRDATRKRNRHWQHHLPLLLSRVESFRSYCADELSRLDDWRLDEAEPADISYALSCLHSRMLSWMQGIVGTEIKGRKKRKRKS